MDYPVEVVDSSSSKPRPRRRSTTRPHRAARTPKNPVYFLTGANRSIGLEFVRQLSTQPTTTIIASVRSLTSDTSALQTLARTSPATIHIIECDVCSADSLSSIEFRVAEILSKHSANLTHIFNIAATSPTPTDTSLTLDPAILAAHMATNVLGPAKVVQVLRRYLARGATVLNVSSGLASLSNAAEAPRACSRAI
ncbi:hypothetical protein J1614_007949 [Plenodomus biglobosus]|nr:hypothetical protein J1614_007949 [Plenodomus biglobosus]